MVDLRNRNTWADLPDDELERKLHRTLRPVAAPEGFADRVLARTIEQASARRQVLRIRGPLVRWSIAATLLITLGLGGYVQQQREKQIEGARARQQVLLALRIAGSTLHAVRDKVDADSMK